PVTGLNSPITTAPGSKTKPDSSAVNPSIFSINNGKIIAVTIIDINTIIPSPFESVNIIFLYTLNSSIGCSNFNCLLINTYSEITPTTKEIHTCGFIQPTFPEILYHYNRTQKQ